MIRLPISHISAADVVPIFREGLKHSRVAAGEKVVVYADSFTNPVYASGFVAAARDLGAEAFAMIQPLINADASNSIGRANPQPLMIEVMKQADLVVDVSTGGMLYSNDHEAILATDTRILRVREPEDILMRLMPSPVVKDRAERGVARLHKARKVRVTSRDGTDLVMEKGDRPASSQYGMADEKGRWDHWGTGLVCTTVEEETVEGLLVLSPGDILFPFERYVTESVKIHFQAGSAHRIEGGREAVMLETMLDSRGDEGARRLSHVGWGIEHRGAWDTMSIRGWDNAGGVEARSVYGNVLLAIGENRDLGGRNASRLHIDIALRNKRLELNGEAIVDCCKFVDRSVA
jgi:2,5-dihydroxypyridine 5,6-dioxygenase